MALRICGPAIITNASGSSDRKVTASWRPLSRRPDRSQASYPEQLLLLRLEVLGRDDALIAQPREPFELGRVVRRGGGRRRSRLFRVCRLVLRRPPLLLPTL